MTYYEEDGSKSFEPVEVFTRCVESGKHALLLDSRAIPDSFFDLGSGVAGELLHKLTTYRMRMAAVVPDPSVHPKRFREFLGEANRGGNVRFFATRDEAIDWLQTTP